MLGCFRRRCISFANGESDEQTIVYWFQSRNFTIDLRLQPSAPGPLVGLQLLQDYDEGIGRWSTRGGGLIICGDHAAQVLGRPADVTSRIFLARQTAGRQRP